MKRTIAYIIGIIVLATYIILAPTNLRLLTGAFCTGICLGLLIDKLIGNE